MSLGTSIVSSFTKLKMRVPSRPTGRGSIVVVLAVAIMAALISPVSAQARPGAPFGLAATTEAGQVALRWTAPPLNEAGPIVGYNVDRDGNYHSTVTGVTEFLDSDVAAGQEYRYQVIAFSGSSDARVFGEKSSELKYTVTGAAGNPNPPTGNPPTNPGTVPPPDPTVGGPSGNGPLLPTDLTAVAVTGDTAAVNPDGIRVSWKAGGGPASLGFNVTRDGEHHMSIVGRSAFVDCDVVAGRTYSYSVSAWAAGEGNFSFRTLPVTARADATPAECKPLTPPGPGGPDGPYEDPIFDLPRNKSAKPPQPQQVKIVGNRLQWEMAAGPRFMFQITRNGLTEAEGDLWGQLAVTSGHPDLKYDRQSDGRVQFSVPVSDFSPGDRFVIQAVHPYSITDVPNDARFSPSSRFATLARSGAGSTIGNFLSAFGTGDLPPGTWIGSRDDWKTTPQFSDNFDGSGKLADKGDKWYFARNDGPTDITAAPDRDKTQTDKRAVLADGKLEMSASRSDGSYSYIGTANDQGEGYKVDPANGVFVEASVRLDQMSPADNAWWAFWLMAPGNAPCDANGNPTPGGSNAYDGDADTGTEVDIFEFVPDLGNGFNQAVFNHDSSSGCPAPAKAKTSPENRNFAYEGHLPFPGVTMPKYMDGNYHRLGLYYAQDCYAFYMDDQLLWKVTDQKFVTRRAKDAIRLTWEIQNPTSPWTPMTGNFGNTARNTDPKVFIDYVNVWEKKESANGLCSGGPDPDLGPEPQPEPELEAPVNLEATPEGGNIRLNWSAGEGRAADGYDIRRNGAGHWSLVEGETEFVDKFDVEAGETYEYIVTPWTKGEDDLPTNRNFGPDSDSVSVTAEENSNPVVNGMGAPTEVAATPDGGAIWVEWKAGTGTPPNGYDIKRNGEAYWEVPGKTKFLDTSITDGEVYTYVVTPWTETDGDIDTRKYGAASIEVSATGGSGPIPDQESPVETDPNAGPNYRQIFRDDFDGDRVSTNFAVPSWNSSPRDTTNSAEACLQKDGELHLSIKKVGDQRLACYLISKTSNYGPGIDSTVKIEYRANVSQVKAKGAWFAGWMYPLGGPEDAPNAADGNPATGSEYDVFEYMPTRPNEFQSAIHDGESIKAEKWTNPPGIDLTEDKYYTFGLEWNKDCAAFFIDGDRVATKNSQISAAKKHSIMLTMEGQTGTQWDTWPVGSLADNLDSNPATGSIDWVEVQKKKSLDPELCAGGNPDPDPEPEGGEIPAPRGVSASVDGVGVRISWFAAPDGVSGYEVLRDQTVIGTVRNVTKFTDTSVEVGKSYSYSVRSIVDPTAPNGPQVVGNSSAPIEVTITSPEVADGPSAVTELRRFGLDGVALIWVPPVDEQVDGYLIERDGGPYGQKLDKLTLNLNDFFAYEEDRDLPYWIDPGPDAFSVPHNYAVQPFVLDADGRQVLGDKTTIFVTPDDIDGEEGGPPPVRNLGITAAGFTPMEQGFAELRWNAPLGTKVTGYSIEKDGVSKGSRSAAFNLIDDPDAIDRFETVELGHTGPRPQPGTFTYSVRAYVDEGEDRLYGRRQTISVHVAANGFVEVLGEPIPPVQDLIVVQTRFKPELVVKWTPHEYTVETDLELDEPSGYNIERNNKFLKSVRLPPFIDGDVVVGEEYRYTVTPFFDSTSGNTEYGPEASTPKITVAPTPTVINPDAPTGLVAEQTDEKGEQVTLTWIAPEGWAQGLVSSYQVMRNGIAYGLRVLESSFGRGEFVSARREFVDNRALTGVPTSYTVVAYSTKVGAAGEGARSEVALITPQAMTTGSEPVVDVDVPLNYERAAEVVFGVAGVEAERLGAEMFTLNSYQEKSQKDSLYIGLLRSFNTSIRGHGYEGALSDSELSGSVDHLALGRELLQGIATESGGPDGHLLAIIPELYKPSGYDFIMDLGGWRVDDNLSPEEQADEAERLFEQVDAGLELVAERETKANFKFLRNQAQLMVWNTFNVKNGRENILVGGHDSWYEVVRSGQQPKIRCYNKPDCNPNRPGTVTSYLLGRASEGERAQFYGEDPGAWEFVQPFIDIALSTEQGLRSKRAGALRKHVAGAITLFSTVITWGVGVTWSSAIFTAFAVAASTLVLTGDFELATKEAAKSLVTSGLGAFGSKLADGEKLSGLQTLSYASLHAIDAKLKGGDDAAVLTAFVDGIIAAKLPRALGADLYEKLAPFIDIGLDVIFAAILNKDFSWSDVQKGFEKALYDTAGREFAEFVAKKLPGSWGDFNGPMAELAGVAVAVQGDEALIRNHFFNKTLPDLANIVGDAVIAKIGKEKFYRQIIGDLVEIGIIFAVQGKDPTKIFEHMLHKLAGDFIEQQLRETLNRLNTSNSQKVAALIDALATLVGITITYAYDDVERNKKVEDFRVATLTNVVLYLMPACASSSPEVKAFTEDLVKVARGEDFSGKYEDLILRGFWAGKALIESCNGGSEPEDGNLAAFKKFLIDAPAPVTTATGLNEKPGEGPPVFTSTDTDFADFFVEVSDKAVGCDGFEASIWRVDGTSKAVTSEKVLAELVFNQQLGYSQVYDFSALGGEAIALSGSRSSASAGGPNGGVGGGSGIAFKPGLAQVNAGSCGFEPTAEGFRNKLFFANAQVLKRDFTWTKVNEGSGEFWDVRVKNDEDSAFKRFRLASEALGENSGQSTYQVKGFVQRTRYVNGRGDWLNPQTSFPVTLNFEGGELVKVVEEDAIDPFDELLATLENSVVVVINAIEDVIAGCVSVGSEAVKTLVDLKDAIVKYSKLDGAELWEELKQKWALIQEIVAAAKEDPVAFAEAFLGGLVRAELFEENKAKWAGAIACDLVFAVLSTGVITVGGKVIQAVVDLFAPGGIDKLRTWRANREKYSCDDSFPAGTLVRLASGDYLPIELIEPGQQVLTYNTATAVWSDNVVLDQWSAVHVDAMATVALSDGSEIVSTEDHDFWVDSSGAWVDAGDLRPGMYLLGPDGVTQVAGVSVVYAGATTVYELDTAVDDNFVVASLSGTDALVHNCTKPSGDGELIGDHRANETQGSAVNKASAVSENRSADNLVKKGYKVEQLPEARKDRSPELNERVIDAQRAAGLDVGKDPDYLVEGKIFDNYGPRPGTSVSRIRDAISTKGKSLQADRVVVDLTESEVLPQDVFDILSRKVPDTIREVIIIGKDGELTTWVN